MLNYVSSIPTLLRLIWQHYFSYRLVDCGQLFVVRSGVSDVVLTSH